MLSSFARLIEYAEHFSKAIGVPKLCLVLARRFTRNNAPVTVSSFGQTYEIRPLDTDLKVATQIFGRQEYDLGDSWSPINRLAAEWKAEGDTPVIIDAGANVGYSALYFAHKVPTAVVVAIEADRGTFEVLCKNVASNKRIKPIHAAVWSHEKGVSMTAEGENNSWAGRVSEYGSRVPSLLLPSTFADIPNGRRLVVKLDVEGAEAEICKASPEILHEVPCIMIEPHDWLLPGAGTVSSLFNALAGRRVDTLLRGENLLIVDSSLRAA